MSYIDLHTHTTFSDGTLSPEEILLLAKHVELEAVAITDHDTMSGTEEAVAIGDAMGITVIPGVEISAKHGRNSMHILGYGLDFKNDRLQQLLSKLQESRNNRNPIIITKLQKMGYNITYEEVIAGSHGEVIGRPHIAMTMVEKKIVRTTEEAFRRFLYDGGPAYAPKEIIEPEEAFQTIIHAGGVPCLAHPWLLDRKMKADQLSAVIESLIPLGLKGIETYYPYTQPHRLKAIRSIAKQFELLEVGGSDFHGTNRSDVPLGKAKVPNDLLDPLLEECNKMKHK